MKGVLFVIDLVKRLRLVSDNNIKFEAKADPGALKPRISHSKGSFTLKYCESET